MGDAAPPVAPLLIAGALAGFGYVVAQRSKSILLGELRPQLIETLIARTREFSPSTADPESVDSEQDFDDEKARAGHLKSIRALTDAPSPICSRARLQVDSRPRARNALIEAQSNQLAGLRVAARFLETGDTEALPADARLQAIMYKIDPTLEELRRHHEGGSEHADACAGISTTRRHAQAS